MNGSQILLTCQTVVCASLKTRPIKNDFMVMTTLKDIKQKNHGENSEITLFLVVLCEKPVLQTPLM